MAQSDEILADMNSRSREVFRRLVETYLETGTPVGSRTLSRGLTEKISPATVRNVMQDLEFMGLLDSPHVSAGRIPSEAGLRLFVDSLLEVDHLTSEDQAKIDMTLASNQADVTTMMDRLGSVLSGITAGASLVLTPKHEAPIRHIEFVSLSPDRALVVLVFADGHVENRLFTPPPGQTPSSMREAANYLNALADGRTISELRARIAEQIDQSRQDLDQMTQSLVKAGLAQWENEESEQERLIVRGRANLLSEGAGEAELAQIRQLFDDLERKRDIARFLDLTEGGEGVRIFIGSQNKLFSLSGSSLVVSPYMNSERKIVGAVAVVGPTRLNYGRVVPIVNYTAELVGKLISDRG